jgi:protein O-mannosyl-transferase
MNLIKNDRAGLKYSATIIMVICAVTFTHTLGFYFLNLDDNLGITMNPMIHQGLSLESIKWAFSTFNSPYYMPLTRISFLIDSSLFGVDAWGFHLTNLLIHTTNSLLILLLFWKLSNHLLFSTLSAIAFAIHPQHLEAFIWISERKEVLSALFGLLSLIFYTRYAQTRAANSSNTSNFKYYLYAILYFLLSLMAKPLWISMPFIFLLIDWWPLNRIKHDPLKIIIIDKIPFIFLAVIFIIITLASAASSVDQISNSAETLPLIQRVLNIPVVYITYLLLTIYPYDLPVYLPFLAPL